MFNITDKISCRSVFVYATTFLLGCGVLVWQAQAAPCFLPHGSGDDCETDAQTNSVANVNSPANEETDPEPDPEPECDIECQCMKAGYSINVIDHVNYLSGYDCEICNIDGSPKPFWNCTCNGPNKYVKQGECKTCTGTNPYVENNECKNCNGKNQYLDGGQCKTCTGEGYHVDTAGNCTQCKGTKSSCDEHCYTRNACTDVENNLWYDCEAKVPDEGWILDNNGTCREKVCSDYNSAYVTASGKEDNKCYTQVNAENINGLECYEEDTGQILDNGTCRAKVCSEYNPAYMAQDERKDFVCDKKVDPANTNGLDCYKTCDSCSDFGLSYVEASEVGKCYETLYISDGFLTKSKPEGTVLRPCYQEIECPDEGYILCPSGTRCCRKKEGIFEGKQIYAFSCPLISEGCSTEWEQCEFTQTLENPVIRP